MSERLRLRSFLIAAVLLLAAAGWLCRHGMPVSTSLTALIPALHQDPQANHAQQAMTATLSHQVLALVGASDEATAVQAATQLATQWQDSGLFSKVDVTESVDLDAVRRQLLAQGLAMTDPAQQDILVEHPALFVQQRLQTIMSPLSAGGLIPLGQDWLGFANNAATRLVPPGPMHLDLASDTLQAQDGATTWVLMLADTRQDAFGTGPGRGLNQLIQASQQTAHQHHAQLLVTGGPLYGAIAQAQAVHESLLIGGGGVLGIILVLLLPMRRARVLFSFIPLMLGIVCGFVACVWVFGTMHILTLAVGISLIGIAANFPLHWLSQAFGPGTWQAWPAIRRVDRTLLISLLVTVIGYAALALTPFPALTQIAVFSTAGLLGAYASTVTLLPWLMRRMQPAPWGACRTLASWILACYPSAGARRTRTTLIVLALLGIASGIHLLRLQDDIRLWVANAPSLQKQAQSIARITHYLPASQFFLVQGPSPDSVLQREQGLLGALDAQIRAGHLDGDTALAQILAPVTAQQRMQAALPARVATDPAWQPFLAAGLTAERLQADIDRWKSLPTVGIDDFLAGPAGLRWRGLWLGRQPDGQYAGLVSLFGMHDADAVAAAAHAQPGVRWIDPVGLINHVFVQTRIQTVYLKLASYVLAAVVLCVAFGWRTSWRITLCAATATLSAITILAVLHIPLTLFGIFGLLLASAIGIDYAIFLYRNHAGYEASYIGVVLSALTTLLTFGLLACSKTPILANFGLAVTLGVTFNVLWAPVFLHRGAVRDAARLAPVPSLPTPDQTH